MPTADVKPYAKRNKTDGLDAETICEAMQRPSMRVLALKSVQQQAVLALHRARATGPAGAPWRPTRCVLGWPTSPWWRRKVDTAGPRLRRHRSTPHIPVL